MNWSSDMIATVCRGMDSENTLEYVTKTLDIVLENEKVMNVSWKTEKLINRVEILCFSGKLINVFKKVGGNFWETNVKSTYGYKIEKTSLVNDHFYNAFTNYYNEEKYKPSVLNGKGFVGHDIGKVIAVVNGLDNNFHDVVLYTWIPSKKESVLKTLKRFEGKYPMTMNNPDVLEEVKLFFEKVTMIGIEFGLDFESFDLDPNIRYRT